MGVCLILCLSLFFCDGVIWCFFNGLSVCYWVIILLFVFFAFLTVVHVDTGPFVFFVRSLLQVLSDCMLVFVLVCLLTVVHSDTGPFVFSLSSIKISPFSLSYRINEDNMWKSFRQFISSLARSFANFTNENIMFRLPYV